MLRLFAGLVFFLIAAFGVLIGVIYPWSASSQNGHELGTWRIFSAENGFAELEMLLPSGEDLFLARIDLETLQPPDTVDDVVLTVIVTSGNRTVSAQGLTLEYAEEREARPGGPLRHYTVFSEPVYTTGGEEPYRFVFGPGAVEFPLVSAELTLIGGLSEIDEAVPPIGWVLMAVGLLGLVFTLRGRRKKPPASPRWGRG